MKRFQTRWFWALVFLFYGMLPLLPVNAQNAEPKPAFEVMVVGPVVYFSHSIDDFPGGTSPNGDGDGRAESGEHVGLAVTLLNQGTTTAIGVEESALTCSDPDITIIDSDNCWPDIPGGQTAENACNYEFQVNPNLAQNKTVDFTMTVTAQNGGPWSSTFTVNIDVQDNPQMVGPLVYSSHSIDDVPGGTSPNGDGDGRAESGEHVGLSVTLLNQGNETAVGVESYTLTCADPDVTILDSANCWPDIPGGQTRENECNYEFQVNPNLAQNKTVDFTMTVTAQNGGPWNSTFTVNIYVQDNPQIVGPLVYSSHFIDDVPGGTSPNGDGDGRAENNEHVALAVTLLNQGNQTAVGVESAILTCSDPDVMIIDSNNCWPDIPGGQTRENECNYEFQVNPDLAQNKTVTFTMTVTAQNGGPWTSTFAVQIHLQDQLTAPSDLSVSALNNTTARLSWSWQDNSPSEQGFKIERKLGAAGSYIEIANVETNVTSYDDGGLTSGTYFYRVRAYVGSIHSDYSNEDSATIPPTTITWQANIAITDAGGGTVTLAFGQAPTATDRLDPALDEKELPPTPPGGVFDARFVLPGLPVIASLKDLRPDPAKNLTWTMNFQPGTAGFPMTLRWNSAELPTEKSFQLKDAVTGLIYNVDMKSQNSLTVTNSAITSLLITSEVTGTVNVVADWNIISVPLRAADMRVSALFPGAASEAFRFDNGYVAESVLSTGIGYWLKFNSSRAYQIKGSIVTPKAVSVKAGWNIIGLLESDVQVSAITSQPSGIITSGYFEFNNGYVDVTTLQVGKGYWVKASQAGTLLLPSGSSASKSAETLTTTNMSMWPAIRITDSRSETRALYLAPDNQAGRSFELPPVPPTGIFDARFSAGQYVESLSASQWEVCLNSAHFPIRIRTENLGGTVLSMRDALGGATLNETLSEGKDIIIASSSGRLLMKTETSLPKQTSYELSQNYPNPFNPTAVIKYTLPEAAHVKISVYSMLGEKVADLVDAELPSGHHQVEVNVQNYTSGVYFYVMESGSFKTVRKMIVAK